MAYTQEDFRVNDNWLLYEGIIGGGGGTSNVTIVGDTVGLAKDATLNTLLYDGGVNKTAIETLIDIDGYTNNISNYTGALNKAGVSNSSFTTNDPGIGIVLADMITNLNSNATKVILNMNLFYDSVGGTWFCWIIYSS